MHPYTGETFTCRIARPASHPESVLTYLSAVLHAYDTSAT